MTTARCIEQGSCPLLRKGKTTRNENKNVARFNTISIMKQKAIIGVFRHAESESNLCFWTISDCSGGFGHFCMSKIMIFFASYL